MSVLYGLVITLLVQIRDKLLFGLDQEEGETWKKRTDDRPQEIVALAALVADKAINFGYAHGDHSFKESLKQWQEGGHEETKILPVESGEREPTVSNGSSSSSEDTPQD